MEYTKVTSLVPNGEHFDATAINEGVFLTAGHLENIETSLAGQETAVQQMQVQVDEAKQATTAVQTQLDAATATIGTKDTEIAALQQQIATLKKEPAGDFTEKAKDKDEHGGGERKEVDPVTAEANKKRQAMGKAPI